LRKNACRFVNACLFVNACRFVLTEMRGAAISREKLDQQLREHPSAPVAALALQASKVPPNPVFLARLERFVIVSVSFTCILLNC
jgi:hypothetical protein